MDRDRWGRIQEVFAGAVEQPESERGAFLDSACGEDAELRREVEALLAADARPPSVLGRSALVHLEGLLDSELAGDHIGGFRVIRRLGTGGMGSVYLAERTGGGFVQKAAIKVIRRGMYSEDVLRRFLHERRILAQLEHPCIARFIDGGTTESGQPYIAMEYVDGTPITEFCDVERLSVEERLELFVTVCEAVQYAHQNLVVHRDLKPGNILIAADRTVKLLDFGIAKWLDAEGDHEGHSQLTRTGMRAMTPAYASPEQLQGAPVTTASDVYSLGVLLFELLTGERPQGDSDSGPSAAASPSQVTTRPSRMVSRRSHEGTDSSAKLSAVCAARRTDVSGLHRKLRGDLDTICLMALRPERERRYQSAGELGEDVKRHLERLPVHAQPDTLGYRTRKFASRYRLAVALAAVFLVVTVALTVVYGVRLGDERDRARAEAAKARQVTAFLTSLFEAADPNVSKGPDLTVKELLDLGRDRIASQLTGQPELRATSLGVIGRSYKQLGELEAARPLLQQSLDLLVAQHGWDHPEVAVSLNEMGNLLYDLGEYDSAAVCDHRAVGIVRRLANGDDTLVAAFLSDLAAAVRHQGQLDSAEVLFREALAMWERVSTDDINKANTQVHFGRLLQIRGRLEEAEPLLREALATHIRLLGWEDFGTIAAAGSLAILLREQGKYDEAIELRRTGLAHMRSIVGEDHHFVGAYLGSLAAVMLEAGRLAEADSLFRESIANHAHTLPEGHVNRAIALLGLGSTLLAEERPGEAEQYLRSALELRQTALGDDHYQTAETKSVLGECCRRLGKRDEARTLLGAAVATLSESLGTDHKLTREARLRLESVDQAS